MAIIICPRCNGKVSDKAEKCPHCGATKEEILCALQNMAREKSKKKIKLELAGHTLEFDEEYKDYITLRRIYELVARELKRNVWEYYNKTPNLGKIIENIPAKVERVMNDVVNISMELLYQNNIRMTPEAFVKKYYGDYKYDIDYNVKISDIVEKYAEIIGEKESLEKYRDMQKVSRSRWQGGGFGLSGAVKGAVMAGALNAGTDFVRSFGDSMQRSSDNAYIEKKINELKKSNYTQGQIIGGAYSAIIGIFYAVYNELQEQHVVSACKFELNQYDKAKNICETAERYETDDVKRQKEYLETVLEYPYYEKVYRLIYKTVRNTTKEKEFFFFLDYFGMDIDIEGITVSTYLEIEKYIDENDSLNSINFKEVNSEQFYIVSDVVDELKKRYDVTLLRKNMSYRQLDDYLDKANTAETVDYETASEKQLPIEEYIPRLIQKCIKTGYIGTRTFDGFLWVKGVDVGCGFEKDIETFNYNRHIGGKKEYILIYENTSMHMGKRGLGIFDEGIVLFEGGEIIFFKDIVECAYDSNNIMLIIRSAHKEYEFQYRFFGSKLLGFLSKDEKEGFSNMGKFVSNLIWKIIKHYQEMNKSM